MLLGKPKPSRPAVSPATTRKVDTDSQVIASTADTPVQMESTHNDTQVTSHVTNNNKEKTTTKTVVESNQSPVIMRNGANSKKAPPRPKTVAAGKAAMAAGFAYQLIYFSRSRGVGIIV